MAFIEDVRRRMETILGRIGIATKGPVGKSENISARKRIENFRNQQKSEMMTMADGNISEYNVIKHLSVEDYLLKFDNFVSTIEYKQRQSRM